MGLPSNGKPHDSEAIELTSPENLNEVSDRIFRFVLILIGLVVSLGVVSAILNLSTRYGLITGLAKDVVALLCTCVLIIFLLFLYRRLPRDRTTRICLSLFLSCALLHRILGLTDEFSALNNVPILGDSSRLHSASRDLLSTAAIGAVCATVYCLVLSLRRCFECFRVNSDRMLKEIADRKRAEESARRNRQELRLITDSVPAFIVYVDSAQRYRFANKPYADALGLAPDQIVGRHVQEVIGRNEYRSVSHHIEAALSGDLTEFDSSVSYRKLGPRLMHTLFVPDVYGDEEVRGFFVIAHDITERKRTEEQIQQHRRELAHISRVNTMGEMASGLAHELNQPLAAISMYADCGVVALQSIAGDDAELSPILEKIQLQSVRAGEIIRRLKRFVSKGPPSCETIQVSEVFDDVLTLLESELDTNGISVDVQMPEVPPTVHADSIQLEQVILNLVHNAAEAITEVQSDRREIVLQARTPQHGIVEIIVRDTGPGMSEETLKHVFDAFYTTKSEGMGIGLAICRTIIESHCGKISVTCNSDGGSTFRIVLPQNGRESHVDL